jgi:hypothetical protein
MEESEDSESGGGEAGGGEAGGDEAGGGEAGGGEEGGGEAGGGEEGGGEAGGGEQGGGEAGGGEQGGGSQGGGIQGGGSQGGSLDDALIASVEGFEDGMQQQILIIASASPNNGMDDASQDIGGGEGAEAAGGGELIDQTGGGVPGLIMIEGDVSQLPQGSGQVGGSTNSSGVVNVNDQGSIENRQTRQGDSQIARILIASIPEDIGDGSDDDVVARQIREAAINEEDPVLREKLWQEYRNYKKSLGRKKF